MQALRILTDFGSFLKKSWQWRKMARKKIHKLVVLVIPQSFHLHRFFQNYEFPEKFPKSGSIF